MKSKRCTRCNLTKPLTMFHRNRNQPDGRRSICKTCKAITAAVYRATHQEERRAYSATYNPRYNASHKDERRLLNTGYRATHVEEVRAYRKTYRAAHQDEHRTYEAARRARKRQAPVNDLSHAQWLEIQEVFQHRCAYCGKRAKGHLTQDHITPLSKGGAHTATNILPACATCNARKHAGNVLTAVQPMLLTVALPRSNGK